MLLTEIAIRIVLITWLHIRGNVSTPALLTPMKIVRSALIVLLFALLVSQVRPVPHVYQELRCIMIYAMKTALWKRHIRSIPCVKRAILYLVMNVLMNSVLNVIVDFY